MPDTLLPMRTFLLNPLFGLSLIINTFGLHLSFADPYDNFTDWAINRGDKKGTQYSELAYIHAANVHHLKPAWEYRAGDSNERSNMHSNPIIIDGLMYFTTSTLRAVAIDAGTGKEAWVFKAEDHHPEGTAFRGRSRGTVYWESGDKRRIFHSVKDRVYALDAKTGKLITSFGENGHIDLRKNLGMDPKESSIEVTNPGIVYKNFLIVVSRVPEGYSSTPGDIRAYDTITGEFKWAFHTIPREGEYGYDTWEWVEGERYGGVNSWGGLTVDEERGWVFASTGSAANDFYGGYRKVKPPPLTRTGIYKSDLTSISQESAEYAARQFERYIGGALYTPPSEQGTIAQPGTLGGVEWHGSSYDPYSNIVYVNSNDAPGILKLTKSYEPIDSVGLTDAEHGRILYAKNCVNCHGIDRKGVPPIYPSVYKLDKPREEILKWIRTGGNIMPAFPHLSNKELGYLASDEADDKTLPESESRTRYLIGGYGFFKDQDGYPAIDPPWGTLNAIDLSKGEFVWRIPLGEYPELAAKGIRNTGTMNYGGAVATAGGLVFIAATADEKMRAFEKSRGKLLWEYQLPAGGYATPSVYMHEGKQYVAIVCGGGGKNRTKSGDTLIAFALPDDIPAITKTTESVEKDSDGWITLFDGETLDGWVHMNGSHNYSVEDGSIVGRTIAGSQNSFLCTVQEFSDFELELDTTILMTKAGTGSALSPMAPACKPGSTAT